MRSTTPHMMFRPLRLIESALKTPAAKAAFFFAVAVLHALTPNPAARAGETGTAVQYFTSENGLSADVVTALAQDWEGKIWVGTEHGVSVFFNDYWERFENRPDYVPSKIVAIAFDPAGDQVWAGAIDGLKRYRLKEGKWSSFGTREGLPNAHVTRLAFDPDKRLWAGTRNGLASLKNDRVVSYQDGDDTGFAGRQVADVTPDSKGRIWAATEAGLMWLEPKSERPFWRPVAPSIDLKDAPITRLVAATEKGRTVVWVGSRNGLYRYLPDSDPPVWENPLRGLWGLPADEREVTDLHWDPDSETLWAGATGAVWAVRGGERFFFKRGVGPVDQIGSDKRGRVWIAGREGLFRIFDTYLGPQFESVSAGSVYEAFHFHVFLADQNNDIWIGTQSGLLRTSLDWDVFSESEISSIGPDLASPGRLWTYGPGGFAYFENDEWRRPEKLTAPLSEETPSNSPASGPAVRRMEAASREGSAMIWALTEGSAKKGETLWLKPLRGRWRPLLTTADARCPSEAIQSFRIKNFNLDTGAFRAAALTDSGICLIDSPGKKTYFHRGAEGESFEGMVPAGESDYRLLTESNVMYFFQHDRRAFAPDRDFTLPLRTVRLVSDGGPIGALMEDPVHPASGSYFASFLNDEGNPGALKFVGPAECQQRYFRDMASLNGDWWLIAHSGDVCARLSNLSPSSWTTFTPYNGLPASKGISSGQLLLQKTADGYDSWVFFPPAANNPSILARLRVVARPVKTGDGEPVVETKERSRQPTQNIWIVISFIGWFAALVLFFSLNKRKAAPATALPAGDAVSPAPAAPSAPHVPAFDIPGFERSLQERGDLEILRRLPRLIYNIPHAMGHDFALPKDIAKAMTTGGIEKESLLDFVSGPEEPLDDIKTSLVAHRPGNLKTLIWKYRKIHGDFTAQTRAMTGFPIQPFSLGRLSDLETLFLLAVEELDNPPFLQHASARIHDLLETIKEKDALAVDRFIRDRCLFDLRLTVFEALKIQYPQLVKGRFTVEMRFGEHRTSLYEGGAETNVTQFLRLCESEKAFYKLPLLHGRFVEALSDILRNAQEASVDAPEKRITITFITDDIDRLAVRIEDRGKGIDPSRLEDIFKEGVSIGKSGPNMGRGLYSARQTVKEHGGDIRAESEGPGKGAAIVIALPT